MAAHRPRDPSLLGARYRGAQRASPISGPAISPRRCPLCSVADSVGLGVAASHCLSGLSNLAAEFVWTYIVVVLLARPFSSMRLVLTVLVGGWCSAAVPSH